MVHNIIQSCSKQFCSVCLVSFKICHSHAQCMCRGTQLHEMTSTHYYWLIGTWRGRNLLVFVNVQPLNRLMVEINIICGVQKGQYHKFWLSKTVLTTAFQAYIHLTQTFSHYFSTNVRSLLQNTFISMLFLFQLELITQQAMKAGFSGGLVIDYPHSSKAKK